jgi:type I restriction enzyme S subunit
MRPYLRVANVFENRIDTSDVYEMNFTPDEYGTYRLKCGDVLLNEGQSKELVGRPAIYRDEVPGACFTNSLIRFTPTEDIQPEWALLAFRTYLHTGVFQSVARWTTNIAHLSANRLGDLPFRIPPVDEQRAIIAEMDKQESRIDAGVAALERVQANLKRYRASVLKAACEGRLVPAEAELARQERRDYEPADVLLKRILAERRKRWEEAELAKLRAKGKRPTDDRWKKKYEEPKPPDTSKMPELPEGWCWTRVGQLAHTVRDGPHFSPKYSESGIPFITGGNVRPEGVDFDAAKRISADLHEEFCRRIRPALGDILYTKGGTTGIARVNTYDREFSVWVHVAVLKLAGPVDPFYVQHALNSPICYAQAQLYTHGVGNQDLGLTRMVLINVPLPPLSEQRRIVSEVDRRLSLLAVAEETIVTQGPRASALRQSILRAAFSGKLLLET